MKKIKFTKMVGSGNDFIIIEGAPTGNLSKLTKTLCDRKFGIGADGVLLLGKRKHADLSMRIFNADGSEAEMCGNGARCAALFIGRPKARVWTTAGVIHTEVCGNQVKIQLTDPQDIKSDIPLVVNGRQLKVNFINTGVPHTVIFVDSLDKIDVATIGKQIRYHKKFLPQGTNVDFVEVLGNDSISVRTYERGVEDETLACGTGSVASALVFGYRLSVFGYHKVNVHTQSGEVLKVYFNRYKDKFKNIWLEGSARIVYKGECYV